MSSTAWTQGVLVGIDGSPGGMRALDWAVDTAVRHDCPLRVLHVRSSAVTFVAPPPTLTNAELAKIAERTLQHALERATARARELEVRGAVDIGGAADVLVRAADTCDLLVVGHRGLGAIERLALGSVSSRVASRASGNVAVVPDSAPETGATRVVVGIDGTADPSAVLELAFEEAAARQVPLVAVHAWEPGPGLALLVSEDWTRAEQLAASDRPRIEALVHPWADKHPDVAHTVVVDQGTALDVLRAIATSDDLVVLGGRRHAHALGLLLGSVTDAFLRRAICPVVVVHPRREP
jgi:nucleotide-binding universal stress UspA family protein